MEMPLVSIILPVYNAQSHLNRCLGSICAQQYEDLEIIVINDGSKDQSLPVCEEFRKKDSRILLVDNRERELLSQSRLVQPQYIIIRYKKP